MMTASSASSRNTGSAKKKRWQLPEVSVTHDEQRMMAATQSWTKLTYDERMPQGSSARGSHETAHYAIATAFMAAGMMLPGMCAGYLQEWMGYRTFFIWVTACCAITFLVTAFLKIDPEFGRKS